MNIQTLLTKLQLTDDEVINIYLYGSRIYGTANSDSDWDFTIVVKNECIKYSPKQTISVDNIDANIHTKYRL